MDTVKLRTDIEHATECLYQNRGQDGLEAVRNLLPQFQEMIQAILCRGRQCACARISGSVKNFNRELSGSGYAGDGGLLKGLAEE